MREVNEFHYVSMLLLIFTSLMYIVVFLDIVLFFKNINVWVVIFINSFLIISLIFMFSYCICKMMFNFMEKRVTTELKHNIVANRIGAGK